MKDTDCLSSIEALPVEAQKMKLADYFLLVDKIMNSIMKPAVIVLSLLVAGMLALGIFTRIIVGSPMFGLEELVLICVMWLYMIGATLASRDRAHLSADFIQVLTKNEKTIAFTHLIASLVSLAMAVLFVTWSYDLFVWALAKKQTTPVFSLPWYISQSSLLFASLFFVYYILRDIVNDVAKLLGKESPFPITGEDV